MTIGGFAPLTNTGRTVIHPYNQQTQTTKDEKKLKEM